MTYHVFFPQKCNPTLGDKRFCIVQHRRSWKEAARDCRRHNETWHLATLDTDEVSTFMFHQSQTVDEWSST